MAGRRAETIRMRTILNVDIAVVNLVPCAAIDLYPVRIVIGIVLTAGADVRVRDSDITNAGHFDTRTASGRDAVVVKRLSVIR